MKIVGYSDRLSVQPGETIRFMVSSETPEYQADIVRLIHGDRNPKGPGFKEELVPSPVSGRYAGKRQTLPKGSYVTVPDSPSLKLEGSFTLQAWIYPTTPEKGVQGILTKGSGTGSGLVIDENGSLQLWLDSGGGQAEMVSSGRPMRASTWHFIAASFDEDAQSVLLVQRPVVDWPEGDLPQTVRTAVQTRETITNDAPVLIGAYDDGSAITGHFNGKIDSPRVFGEALDENALNALARGASLQSLDYVLAAWDFSIDLSTRNVRDASTHHNHGRTVNMPARAMTGYNWTGDESDFKHAPEQYGAIHFHDDDLDDAGWEADFELTIPEGLRSGVYAARLRAEDAEDHIPFFVRPKRGSATAEIAFLAPTFSYLAYANMQLASNISGSPIYNNLPDDFEYPKADEDRYMVEHNLLSLYERHSDDSGVCYSSYLRPILNMRPSYYSAALADGRGSPDQFSADLHLIDWLEGKGHRYDVITDEDLYREGVDLLSPYRVILSGSHPEYWSGGMLDSVESYLRNGGRFMYLGGNGFYWVTSMDDEEGHTIEIRRWGGTQTWKANPGESHLSTSGELGGTWRGRGRAPQRLMGVGFISQGFDVNAPYNRKPDSFDPKAAFIFDGIEAGERIGDFPSLVMDYGAAGFELDRVDYSLGTPAHTLLLATADEFSDAYQHVIEEVLSSDSHQGGTVNPNVVSDMVYITYPNGGGVFSVGSISWCGSLSYSSYENNVSRVTDNVLRRFASDQPLP